ncbi:MAG: tetratricopeptide repeat protein [Cyclobacteriaceae bacterium]|nr:tetratricopeptide repeat protein [Cyclobacteriaceae bacterium]
MKAFWAYRVGLIGLLVVFSSNVWAQRDRKKKEADPQSAEMQLHAELFFTEGEKFFILEDYAKALYYYQKSLEINPANATVHYKIAEVLAKSEKPDDRLKASISIQQALQLDKANKYFYLLGSSIYASMGQFGKAGELIKTLIEQVPGQEEYLFQLAALQTMDKKPGDALETYNRIEQRMGISETSSIQKQQLYLEMGKTNEALAEGEKLVKAFPDEERYAVGLAEFLSQQNQNARAIAVLTSFVGTHAEATSARMLLAGLYLETGADQDARVQIEILLRHPQVELSSKLLMLGSYQQSALTQTNDPSRQVFTSRMAALLTEQYPGEPDVLLMTGDLFMSNGEREQARKAYSQAVKRGISQFEAWQNLCALELELGMMDSLLIHTEQALELFPNQASLHYFSGYALWRQRDLRTAATQLEQGKRLAVGQVGLLIDLNMILGEVYQGLRDFPKSNQAFDDVLTLAPNHEFVLNNYSYYLALRKENLEKAERMAAQLIKDHAENANYWDTYAWVLFMREKYKDARKAMERCIQTGTQSPTHFEHYGDILFKLGEEEGALAQWRKAKSLGAGPELIDKKIANRKLN